MTRTIFIKELKETLLAMKGILLFIVASFLFSIFCFAIVSVKELSLLAQNEVILNFSKIVIELTVLTSIILAAVGLSHERESETLESLLLTPVSTWKIALGKISSAIFIGFTLMVISLPYLIALSQKSGATLIAILLLLFIGLIMAIAFSMIAFSISILIGNSKNAILTSLIVFIVTAVPSFLPTTTKKAGIAMYLNQYSPMSSSFNFLKNILVNKVGTTAISDLMPLLIFCIFSFIFLLYGIKHIGYKGGE